jgi:hypothetical protein
VVEVAVLATQLDSLAVLVVVVVMELHLQIIHQLLVADLDLLDKVIMVVVEIKLVSMQLAVAVVLVQ